MGKIRDISRRAAGAALSAALAFGLVPAAAFAAAGASAETHGFVGGTASTTVNLEGQDIASALQVVKGSVAITQADIEAAKRDPNHEGLYIQVKAKGGEAPYTVTWTRTLPDGTADSPSNIVTTDDPAYTTEDGCLVFRHCLVKPDGTPSAELEGPVGTYRYVATVTDGSKPAQTASNSDDPISVTTSNAKYNGGPISTGDPLKDVWTVTGTQGVGDDWNGVDGLILEGATLDAPQLKQGDAALAALSGMLKGDEEVWSYPMGSDPATTLGAWTLVVSPADPSSSDKPYTDDVIVELDMAKLLGATEWNKIKDDWDAGKIRLLTAALKDSGVQFLTEPVYGTNPADADTYGKITFKVKNAGASGEVGSFALARKADPKTLFRITPIAKSVKTVDGKDVPVAVSGGTVTAKDATGDKNGYRTGSSPEFDVKASSGWMIDKLELYKLVDGNWELAVGSGDAYKGGTGLLYAFPADWDKEWVDGAGSGCARDARIVVTFREKPVVEPLPGDDGVKPVTVHVRVGDGGTMQVTYTEPVLNSKGFITGSKAGSVTVGSDSRKSRDIEVVPGTDVMFAASSNDGYQIGDIWVTNKSDKFDVAIPSTDNGWWKADAPTGRFSEEQIASDWGVVASFEKGGFDVPKEKYTVRFANMSGEDTGSVAMVGANSGDAFEMDSYVTFEVTPAEGYALASAQVYLLGEDGTETPVKDIASKLSNGQVVLDGVQGDTMVRFSFAKGGNPSNPSGPTVPGRPGTDPVEGDDPVETETPDFGTVVLKVEGSASWSTSLDGNRAEQAPIGTTMALGFFATDLGDHYYIKSVKLDYAGDPAKNRTVSPAVKSNVYAYTVDVAPGKTVTITAALAKAETGDEGNVDTKEPGALEPPVDIVVPPVNPNPTYDPETGEYTDPDTGDVVEPSGGLVPPFDFAGRPNLAGEKVAGGKVVTTTVMTPSGDIAQVATAVPDATDEGAMYKWAIDGISVNGQSLLPYKEPAKDGSGYTAPGFIYDPSSGKYHLILEDPANPGVFKENPDKGFTFDSSTGTITFDSTVARGDADVRATFVQVADVSPMIAADFLKADGVTHDENHGNVYGSVKATWKILRDGDSVNIALVPARGFFVREFSIGDHEIYDSEHPDEKSEAFEKLDLAKPLHEKALTVLGIDKSGEPLLASGRQATGSVRLNALASAQQVTASAAVGAGAGRTASLVELETADDEEEAPSTTMVATLTGAEDAWAEETATKSTYDLDNAFYYTLTDDDRTTLRQTVAGVTRADRPIAVVFQAKASGNTPGGDTPGGNTPGGNTPGGDTPGGNTPGGTPGGTITGTGDANGDGNVTAGEQIPVVSVTNNGSVSKGSGTGATVTFADVKVNGKRLTSGMVSSVMLSGPGTGGKETALPRGLFTVADNPLRVTLNPAFLESLLPGTYTLRIVTADGVSSQTVTISVSEGTGKYWTLSVRVDGGHGKVKSQLGDVSEYAVRVKEGTPTVLTFVPDAGYQVTRVIEKSGASSKETQWSATQYTVGPLTSDTEVLVSYAMYSGDPGNKTIRRISSMLSTGDNTLPLALAALGVALAAAGVAVIIAGGRRRRG